MLLINFLTTILKRGAKIQLLLQKVKQLAKFYIPACQIAGLES